MKKILSLLIALTLSLGVVTVSAEELSVYQYRNIYLDFAAQADIRTGVYNNCLNKDIDGMIMLDLNKDNVPELLTYVKEETAYNENMGVLTPESEGYDNPYWVDTKYYLEDTLSIVNGKVEASQPWIASGNQKGMPMALLPDEISELPTELATMLTTFDGEYSFFTFTTDEKPFNVLTYKNNKFEYKSLEYTDLNSHLGEERGAVVSVEISENSMLYDCLFMLLDKYETELNKQNADYKVKVSDWARDEINTAIESGLLPEKMQYDNLEYVVTRGEFAACVVNMYEKKFGKVEMPETDDVFNDIKNHKYEEEIKKAYYLGITNGYVDAIEGDLFGPDLNVEREDIATMLCRAFKKANLENWTLETDNKFAINYFDAPEFSDDYKISLYAKPSVYFMAKYGIVKGIGNNRFAPNWSEDGTGFATRQEVIIMTLRFFNCDFSGDNNVNYTDVITNYVKNNHAIFSQGFMLTDLNKDAVPELFSLKQSGDRVVARFHEFKGNHIIDTETEFVIGNSITEIGKCQSKYLTPINYCDVFWNSYTGENCLVCSYSDDSESVIVDNIYYAYRVLNLVGYDGRNIYTDTVRVTANEDKTIKDIELSDLHYSEDCPYICVFGENNNSIENIEKFLNKTLNEFKENKLIPDAPDGTAEYFVKDTDPYFSMNLIPKYYISYEDYISSKENGTPIVINDKSYFVEYDEYTYEEFGEASLVSESGEGYSFYVPKAGGKSEVQHFCELPAVYAKISPDVKITFANDAPTPDDPMTEILETREYYRGAHGYKVTIKDNMITEMIEIYGE